MKQILKGLTVFAVIATLVLAGCVGPVNPNSDSPELAAVPSPQPATPISVTGVLLSTTTLNLITGDTETLSATITPDNATNKNVTWSSNDDGIASVDNNGIVTAVSVGSATITVTTVNGGFTADCTVTVIAPLPPEAVKVTGVSLNQSSLAMTVGGSPVTLVATIQPTNAANKTLNWSSSDSSVATVTNGVVTAVGAGPATITVTTVDGSKTATCAVTVTQPVTSVSLNKTTLNLTTGNTETLTATVQPTNATNKNVTWSSNKPAVATVTTNGVVSAVGEGSATITVTTVDGAKTATCTVTVTNPIVVPPIDNSITAVQLVANMTIGWNLGNSLDATDGWNGKPNPTVDEMERGWGNPATTKAMITALKNAGFNTIRIPVSWTKASSGSPNYTIRADWMARVKQVVDYAVDNDMYIILNTHHDEEVFKFMNTNAAAGQAAFKKIWEQIADAFKSYNEKLIFEGLNEPRTKGSGAEWNGGTAEERNNLNKYYEIFLKAVRDSGGNNAQRFLLINPYAASGAENAMNGLELPTDTATNKLIVSFHNYAPNDFALEPNSGVTTWNESNSSTITGPIDRYYNKFIRNGIPVIIGEFGATNKGNESARAAWAKYYVEYAWSKGIKCVWWDNNVIDTSKEAYRLLNRDANPVTFAYPALLNGLMAGVGTPGTPPVVTPPSSNGREIYLGKNEYSPGYLAKLPLSEFLGSGFKVVAGDTYTLTYTFTSDVTISGLMITFIDGSQPPNYWTELVAENSRPYLSTVTASTPYTGSYTLRATTPATNTSQEANQFVFNIGADTGAPSAPTLTFTELTLTKN